MSNELSIDNFKSEPRVAELGNDFYHRDTNAKVEAILNVLTSAVNDIEKLKTTLTDGGSLGVIFNEIIKEINNIKVEIESTESRICQELKSYINGQFKAIDVSFNEKITSSTSNIATEHEKKSNEIKVLINKKTENIEGIIGNFYKMLKNDIAESFSSYESKQSQRINSILIDIQSINRTLTSERQEKGMREARHSDEIKSVWNHAELDYNNKLKAAIEEHDRLIKGDLRKPLEKPV